VTEFSIFVGVDWGSESHQVYAIDDGRNVLLDKAFAHSGEGLGELVEALLALADGRPERIAVAIEKPHGAVVETLLERKISVFAINPKQLDRFRDRHTVAGAKDDRRDALVLADSLRTDRHAFRQVRLGDPKLVQLREMSRIQDRLKAERVALGNQLLEQLNRYFPQILELGSVYKARWLWELIKNAPTPELASRLSLKKLASLLKKHRVSSLQPERVREILRAEPLRVAPGVTAASSKHALLIVARLQLVNEQKAEIERDIEMLLEELSLPEQGKTEHRDAQLLRSLPGLGKLVCATILAEAWEPLARRDYTTLRLLSGVAPVTKKTGKRAKRPTIIRRTSRNPRLGLAIHYWAENAARSDSHWKSRYASARAAGHSHGRACRGIGDRLLAVMIAMLKTNSLYDPQRRRAPRGLGQAAPLPAFS
jgi:transposase